MKRKIAIVLVDRANYGRLKPVIKEISSYSDLELQLICAGTMLLDRFGDAVRQVEKDGFRIASRIYMELEGSVPITMTKSLGIAVGEFASELYRLKPDILLVIGDRYEALAATLAAAYLNICIAHIQGGEVSGSIDESARHAITKFAHYHFPATERAADYIIRMGERPETVFLVGCPTSDVIAQSELSITKAIINHQGIGHEINPSLPYIVVVFHPVTTKYGTELEPVEHLFDALQEMGTPVCWLWPNIDAGADHISKFLRQKREMKQASHFRFVKNYSPEDYLKVLNNAICLVGNSSSFVRESSLLGVPVVLIGDRQFGREIDINVLPTSTQQNDILTAIKKQIAHGRYSPSKLYGSGNTSEQIAKALMSVLLYHQKTLAYVIE